MWRGFAEILLEVKVGKQPAQTGLTEDQKTGLNPAAIPVAELARMLGVPEVQLRRHVDEGAPTNADGTINLVQYAAWLNALGNESPAESNEGTHGD